MTCPAAVWEQARHIRLLIVDVDGVLTDGRIIFTSTGDEIKFFHVRDGHGIKLAQQAGITVAFITGRQSAIVDRRARELGITHVYQQVRDKAAVLAHLLDTLGLEAAQVCAVGDDLVDLSLFSRVGLSVAVADAVPEVRDAALCITTLPGGRGAVREVCELLLQAQGQWENLVRQS